MLRLRPDVEWRDIDGEVVVLNFETSAYLAVNRTGAVLWPLVAGGATEDQLADALLDRFGLDREDALADVRAFAERLRILELVEEGP